MKGFKDSGALVLFCGQAKQTLSVGVHMTNCCQTPNLIQLKRQGVDFVFTPSQKQWQQHPHQKKATYRELIFGMQTSFDSTWEFVKVGVPPRPLTKQKSQSRKLIFGCNISLSQQEEIMHFYTISGICQSTLKAVFMVCSFFKRHRS